MNYGYARVSTGKQNLRSQLDRLVGAGIGLESIYTDTASGSGPRPRLETLLSVIERGDTVVCTDLDRLGRSVADLAQIARHIDTQGATLRVLNAGIDTAGAAGTVVFHVLATMAQFEREQLRERTMAGLAAAKAKGIKIGAKPKLGPIEERSAVAWRNDGYPITEIARKLNVSRWTVQRCLKRKGLA